MLVATSAHRVRESKDRSRILPIKEVVKTYNSNQHICRRENKYTAMLSLPRSLHCSFLSFFVSSNE